MLIKKHPLAEAKLKVKILKEFYNLLPLFLKWGVNILNLYKPSVNYKIRIKKDVNRNELLLLFSPLYSILREELLVLKKMLKDLLDKGFIKVSNFLAKAPVLFIWKLRGGLRFCYDYKTLNAITVTD